MTSKKRIRSGSAPLFACGFALSTFLAACAPATNDDGTYRISTDAVEAGEEARLNEATEIWAEESGEGGDPFSAGKAAYDIASVTHDQRWAREANRRLADARDVLPGFAQATAYQGSAQSLIARDYPVRGVFLIIPGPGYARMYHVWRGVALMNRAVKEAPQDPVVRLVRAATVSRLPRLLVNRGPAREDFVILEQWAANPGLNPEYAEILTSEEWRRPFFDELEAYKAETGDS